MNESRSHPDRFINAEEPGTGTLAYNPALGRQRQEDWKFQTSLGWMMRPCLRTRQKNPALSSWTDVRWNGPPFPQTHFLVEISWHSYAILERMVLPFIYLFPIPSNADIFLGEFGSFIIALKTSILKYGLHMQCKSCHFLKWRASWYLPQYGWI